MARGSKSDWPRFLAIALLVGIVGYVLGRPYLETWLGAELPTILEEEQELNQGDYGPSDLTNPAAASNESTSAATSQKKSNRSGPRVNGQSPGASGQASSEPTTTSWKLKELSGNRFQSPAGLIYGIGPEGEHRLEHVMRHAKDDPGRPTHGVFQGTRDEILRWLDEGFELTKQQSNRVTRSNAGSRTEFTIKMNRSIGYVGGKSGKRENFPKVDRLKLILENENQVITAYPVR